MVVSNKYLEKKELANLRKKLNNKILLVVDDAYDEYMKDKNYSSGLNIFKNKKNVFILRTFSKIYGLAALRIGWGYGPKKIIDAMNIIKPPFNVNMVAQLAAVASLKDKSFVFPNSVMFANKNMFKFFLTFSSSFSSLMYILFDPLLILYNGG